MACRTDTLFPTRLQTNKESIEKVREEMSMEGMICSSLRGMRERISRKGHTNEENFTTPHEKRKTPNSDSYNFPFLPIVVLSTLIPSSSSSSTLKSGNTRGIILLGLAPSTTLYLSKSSSPNPNWRRKSSSVVKSPFTWEAGEESSARMACENIVWRTWMSGEAGRRGAEGRSVRVCGGLSEYPPRTDASRPTRCSE